MAMIRLPYIPGAVEWVYTHADVKAKLAVSDRNSSFVHIYDPRSGSNEPIASKQVCSSFFFFFLILLLFLVFFFQRLTVSYIFVVSDTFVSC